MSALILFDDDDRGLSPLCDLRASFELRTGALTTAERLAHEAGRGADALLVPDSLAPLVASRWKQPVNELPAGERFVFLNGRWPSAHGAALPATINTALRDEQGVVLAALLDRERAQQFINDRGRKLEGVGGQTFYDAAVLHRPWHVLAHADRNLPGDLEVLAERLEPVAGDQALAVTIVGGKPVLVGKNVTIHPHVVFDTSAGPIAIDDGAEIRSMGVLVGPGYIGAGTVITNHAHIRGHCVIGPVCKVGGEVNSCVFQGFSNKAHSGYLGNTWVGEWVNLGADTVTSNLKNTYGPVRMQCDPKGRAQDTGMLHLGSIIGDHVKTAIGTRLATGSCIHTGAMLAVTSFPPKCIEPFAFLTDGAAQRYDFDKFCEVAQTMMSRRELSVTAGLRHRLRELYER